MIPIHLSAEECALVASLLPEDHPLRSTLTVLPALDAEASRIASVIDRRRLSATAYAQVEADIQRLRDRQDREAPHVYEAQRLSALLTTLHGDRL